MQKIEPPCIFISHAWEDKVLVRRLESELKAAGAEVWVDHAGIRGGDNLPERINDALEWCNTLLLIWSKQAKASHWVKLEWSNAISLRKLIIPCPIDGTPVPPIMASTAYVDFSNNEQGLQRLLLYALQLAQTGGADSVLANVIHTRLAQAQPASIPKPPQDEPEVKRLPSRPPVVKSAPSVRPAIIQLRATPVNSLGYSAVLKMLRDKNFFQKGFSGKGIEHHYESIELWRDKLVIDHATGLTWQQSGSEKYMPFEEVEAYVRQLNDDEYGCHADWRLPTLEEAMSLMEPEKKNGDLYIDPIFDETQGWIWTADKKSVEKSWVVIFYYGECRYYDIGTVQCVRAVRS